MKDFKVINYFSFLNKILNNAKITCEKTKKCNKGYSHRKTI